MEASVSEANASARVNLCLSPDAEITVVRGRGGVLIQFTPEANQHPVTLEPELARLFIRIGAAGLVKSRLTEGVNLATLSWSAVCLLAQLRLGAAVTVRAVEE